MIEKFSQILPQKLEYNSDTESELSQEVLEKIMTKVQDIDKYGTAFSLISSEGLLPVAAGVGKENSKFRNILKNGLVGVSPDRPGIDRVDWGVKNSVEEYIEDLKEKRERPPEVFFNIVGRYGNPKSAGGGSISEKTISKIPLMRMGDLIAIMFSLDKFDEKNNRERSGKNGQNQATKKGTFGIHNFGRGVVDDPNEHGDFNADCDYGFKLSSRVQPRMFTGIVFRKEIEINEEEKKSRGIFHLHGDYYKDTKGNVYLEYDIGDGKKLYGETSDFEILKEHAQKIAQDLLIVNLGKEDNLVPIYDTYGNLWWPKQISHEEIVRITNAESVQIALKQNT